MQILRNDFDVQSYLSTAEGPNALLPQSPNNAIVDPIKVQTSGKLISLHPDSQTPVAVRVHSGRSILGGRAGVPVVLTPGAVWRPNKGGFESIEWGLPFGWLGGGLAQLIVSEDVGASFLWPPTGRDVLFHRIRLPIAADQVIPVNPTGNNWPTRFPWPAAATISGGTTLAQGAKPGISVVPTRTVMVLRDNGLVNPATMRVVFRRSLVDIGSAPPGFSPRYFDVDWPAVGTSLAVGYPSVVLPDASNIFGGDQDIVELYDISGGDLAGTYVDIFRYGRI